MTFLLFARSPGRRRFGVGGHGRRGESHYEPKRDNCCNDLTLLVRDRETGSALDLLFGPRRSLRSSGAEAK